MTNAKLAVTFGASLVFCAGQSSAQNTEFSWEGEIEIGLEEVFDSDDPANELRDVYLNVELGGELAFSNGIAIFSTLKAESVEDLVEDRTFEDIGLFVEELGVSFPIGSTATLTVGKFAPTFGVAWDAAAGFFGSSIAEDYELTEQLGFAVDVEFDQVGGVLSAAVFYADDTVLSESVGTDRGRNDSDFGGAGNTGELDNATLTWTQYFGDDTAFQFGIRHLSASTGDVDDETGAVASISHVFDNGFGVFAELAAFENFGGSADDATFATLNGVYGIGNTSISGTYATRDLDSEGDTDLFSVAVEYEFSNGILIGGALAHVDEAGTSNDILGLNVIIPLGG